MQLSYTFLDIETIVRVHLVPRLEQYTIFTFTGPLGAGKTTIIKEFLRQCGVNDVVTSPTFGYVNTYQGSHNRAFNHFDLYRIDSIEMFINAGFDELLVQKNTCNLIEWPEVIQPLLISPSLKRQICHITLTYGPSEQNSRTIEIIP